MRIVLHSVLHSQHRWQSQSQWQWQCQPQRELLSGWDSRMRESPHPRPGTTASRPTMTPNWQRFLSWTWEPIALYGHYKPFSCRGCCCSCCCCWLEREIAHKYFNDDYILKTERTNGETRWTSGETRRNRMKITVCRSKKLDSLVRWSWSWSWCWICVLALMSYYSSATRHWRHIWNYIDRPRWN